MMLVLSASSVLFEASRLTETPSSAGSSRISAVSELGERLPRRGLPGPPPDSQGTQKKGTEEHDNADEQQVQQALGNDTHDAEHHGHDHQE
jgi:hypothetical protein